MSCSKCANHKSRYTCDVCYKTICNECSALTSTEERCMNLSKRKLKFLCPDCEENLVDYIKPNEVNKNLRAENQALRKQILELTNTDISLQPLNEKSNLMDEIQTIITSTIKDQISMEVSQIRQEIVDLKESNKDMIRLLTAAPLHTTKETITFSDKLKRPSTTQINKISTKHSPLVTVQHATNTINQSKHVVQEQVEDGFQEVRSRPRKKKSQIGTSEIPQEDKMENEFEGRTNDTNKNKKIWLFISRTKSHVTDEIVKSYISRKTQTEKADISVKLLKTYYQTVNNNCFLVGVDPGLKTVVYDSKFWPKGVAFARFDLNEDNSFLTIHITHKIEDLIYLVNKMIFYLR